MNGVVPFFEGKEVRVIERDGEPWFPLVDLAEAWGINRKTPGNLIDRNKEIFDGMAHVGVCNIPDDEVNERGLYLLMGKISADRLKNPQAKEALIRFQRWVPELIQRYRKKEIVPKPEPVQELDEVIAFDLIEARQIATLTETDPKVMQAAILRKHGYPELADVMAPSVVHGESGWYNPTRLVALCNDPDLTPERLNWYLKNKGFQVKENGIWRLTPAGLIHGKEYPFNAPSGHSEPRIAWRESVLYASGLKRPLAEDQMALPAHAGAQG